MTTSSPAIRSVLLYKTEGSADKFYGLTIVPDGDLFRLNYVNGRRGAAMNPKPKLNEAVTLDVATKEFEKVLKSKMKDGYTSSDTGIAYTHSPDAGRVTGYKPMLPADLPKTDPQQMLKHLLESDDWGMQEKKDGEHRGLIIQDGRIQGTNKQGLLVNTPQEWSSFSAMGNNTLCGEHIGETYHVFDLVDAELTFEQRYAKLEKMVEKLLENAPGLPIKLVRNIEGTEAKRAHLERIDAAKGEGVVFKRLNALYEDGKNSNSYRHKLYEAMTCFVLNVNTQRSVAIGAKDPQSGTMIPLGNVTIPPNHAIPAKSGHVDVRYLYRHNEGALCQPTYLGPRSDVMLEAITTDQITRIKYAGQDIDLDDETLSAQALQALAREEFPQNIETLKSFVSISQLSAMTLLAEDENDGQSIMDKAQAMANRIRQMPQVGDTEDQGLQAVAYLRYTDGYDEWLIAEKGIESPRHNELNIRNQDQALGWDSLHHKNQSLTPESIATLIGRSIDLDFDFEPIIINDHIEDRLNAIEQNKEKPWAT